MAGARSVMQHMSMTLPKVLARVTGSTADYGWLMAINPALIIVLVPLVQPALAASSLNAYWTIVVGSAVVAASPLIAMLGESSVAAMAGFIVVESIGEAVYSPLVIDFSMMMSPIGREGVYSTTSMLPTLVSTLVTGYLSGVYLRTFCPTTTTTTSPTLSTTAIAPTLTTIAVASVSPAVADGASSVHAETYQCPMIWGAIAIAALTTPAALACMSSAFHTFSVRRRMQSTATTLEAAVPTTAASQSHGLQ
jgi:hypothetical protein